MFGVEVSGQWTGVIDTRTAGGTVVAPEALGIDGVAASVSGFGTAALEWGLDDVSSMRVGVRRNSNLEVGEDFGFGSLRFVNDPSPVAAFGGGILELAVSVTDPEASDAEPFVITATLEITWQDGTGNANDPVTGADDRITLTVLGIEVPEGSPVTLALDGFDDPGSDESVDTVTATEFDDVTASIIGRLEGASAGEADLVVDAITQRGGATGIGIGDPIPYDVVVRNAGDAPVAPDVIEVDLRRADAPWLSEGSLDLARGELLLTEPLVPGESVIVPISGTLSDRQIGAFGLGTFAIEAQVDRGDLFSEANETNNTLMGPNITLVGDGRTEVVVTAEPVSTEVLGFDESTALVAEATVWNITDTVTPFRVSVRTVLSRDSQATFFDRVVESESLSPIPANSSVMVQQTLDLPESLSGVPDGFYTLFAWVPPLSGSSNAGPSEYSDSNNQALLARVLVSEQPAIVVEQGLPALGSPAFDFFVSVLAGSELDGRDGFDTARYAVKRLGITESVMPDGSVEISAADGSATDTLTSIEKIVLDDGAYLYDLEGEGVPFSYRLYSAAFARTPDEGGLRFWSDQREAGAGDRQMANAFISSAEFEEKFGEDPTDEAFIAALYQNVLLREPDAGGQSFWLDVFAAGTLDRADMLLAFSDSAENIERNAANYDDGIWVL
ncbi:MAG: DUF4214 domain-containing protein [Pseudomonadota bacterium]